VVIGIPSSGVHSNGLTLARRALPDLEEAPPELGGRTVGETLLEPTVIYVRAVMDLLRSDVDVRGLAHITSGGLGNLLRLEADVGYRIDHPLPTLPIFDLIAERSGADDAELHEVFNMGCGFCCVVPAAQADEALELLAPHHPGAAVIGSATGNSGVVERGA
jgi:phosphoribosylformylglycinamidine cyclo-ligase